MATGIQVLHIEKRIAIASGLNRHITRKQFVNKDGVRTVEVWVPDNANPDKTAGNVELISRERVDSEGRKFELTLQQAVDLRVKEAGVKPRKGQSTCLEMIFSGSRDVMTTMSREELLQWADDTLTWAQETWGKDNVVSASLHVDETTPHIHMIVVPIVTGESRRTRLHKQQKKSSRKYNIDHDRLRLCVNEVYTQGKLYEYHDSYAEKVSLKYGLSRGVKAEPGSKKKHTNSIEYNRKLAVQAAEQKALIASLKADYTDKENNLSDLEGQIERQKEIIESNNAEIDRQISSYQFREQQISTQDRQIAENKSIIEEQKGKISSMSQITLESIDAEIESKLSEKESLNESIVQTNQELANLKIEFETKVKQLQAQANLQDVPKKGLFGGYKTEDVDSFITRVGNATILQMMSQIASDLLNGNSQYYKELNRLQQIEIEYNKLYNSIELLQGRTEELRDQDNKKNIKATIEYVFEKTVSSVNSYTIEKTSKGIEAFATFRLSTSPTVYAVYITPDENFHWTKDSRVTSLQKAKELRGESIWWTEGRISEIRQQRELEKASKANQSESRGRGRRR